MTTFSKNMSNISANRTIINRSCIFEVSSLSFIKYTEIVRSKEHQKSSTCPRRHCLPPFQHPCRQTPFDLRSWLEILILRWSRRRSRSPQTRRRTPSIFLGPSESWLRSPSHSATSGMGCQSLHSCNNEITSWHIAIKGRRHHPQFSVYCFDMSLYNDISFKNTKIKIMWWNCALYIATGSFHFIKRDIQRDIPAIKMPGPW